MAKLKDIICIQRNHHNSRSIENHQQRRPPINELRLAGGMSITEYLKGFREENRARVIEAVYKCLDQDQELLAGHIERTARDIWDEEHKHINRLKFWR